MPAKICPRCGNLYEDLKSKTCPNCFAVLELIDRDTAQAMARARAEAEQTPEFQEIKAAEDERWREQSFGACLGVVGIIFATLVFAAVLIGIASHRQHRHATGSGTATTPQVAMDRSRPTGPAANASLEEVMPAQVGPYDRTLRESVPLAGVSTPVLHAAYALHDDPLRAVDVFAIPADRPPREIDEFQSSLVFAAQVQKQEQRPRPYLTRHWDYTALGASSNDFFQKLDGLFRGG